MTKMTIVNTRPSHLQDETNNVIQEAGFAVLEFPSIEIIGADDSEVLTQLESVNDQDVIIFTSQFAVKYTFLLNPRLSIKDSNTVIAVGRKSAEILEQNISLAIWVPEKQNSEGVIELLRGLKRCSKIVLITAENGRGELQEFARSNQIPLQQINTYQRIVPKLSSEKINQLSKLENYIFLATSVTTLVHLQKMLPASIWQKVLFQPLLCASNRIEAQAKQLGFETTLNSNSADIYKMLKVLKKANI